MAGDPIKYHQWCISDAVAMSAYQEAIRKTVRPGDVVVDLGAGTGILSYMACQAGARKVYAVEPGEIIALIPQIAADNGFSSNIECRRASSLWVDLPEKADVIIASMFGSAGIGNDMVKIVIDARERLLKSGGAIIPLGMAPVFCPIELSHWYATKVDFWNLPRNGFDFRAARTVAVNRIAGSQVKRTNLLAVPKDCGEIRLDTISSPRVSFTLNFSIERSGTLHAIAGWTQITMAEGVRCSNSPLDCNPMPWDQMVLPLESAVEVKSGDYVEVTIGTTVGVDTILTWKVSVRESTGRIRVQLSHSTFEGALLMNEDLTRRTPGFVPKLSDWAKAELVVLQMTDGIRSLDEIAAKILDVFPNLMKHKQNALTFAAGVIRLANRGQS